MSYGQAAQAPNAASRSQSNAASACQISVPPSAKKPCVGLVLIEEWYDWSGGGGSKLGIWAISSIGTT